MDWQAYMQIMNDGGNDVSSKGVPLVDPMSALDFFKKRYG